MERRVSTSKRLIFVNSASTLATRLLNITVIVWIQQYLLKRITVEEYSLLPIVFSLMIFFPFFISIVTGGIKRYVLVAYANNDDEHITQIVSTMLPLLVMVSLVIMAIGGVLVWKIDSVLKISPEYLHDARIMFGLIVSLTALKVPLEAFNNGLYVHQRFVLQNLIMISCEIFRLSLLFALLFGVGASVIWVVTATTAAGIVEASILTVISLRLLPSQRFAPSKIDWSVAKELIGFGGWSSMYGFAGMIRKSADPFILNRFATSLDVACFYLGSLVANRLEIILNQSIRAPISAAVIGMHSERQHNRIKHVYLRIGRFTLWGALIVVAPFLTLYDAIIALYVGKEYLAAGTVMLLLLACFPIICGNILHTVLANAHLRMRSLAVREVISTVSNLILTLVLVVYYQLGALGSALATFTTYGLGSILLFWPFGRSLASATWVEIGSQIIAPGIAPFCSAVIVIKLSSVYFTTDSWSAIAYSVMAGVFVYLIVLWSVAKDIDREQFKAVLLNYVARRA